MQLVITEKPSVAQAVSHVIGADERKDGYMEGNGFVVSWCIGHLVELALRWSSFFVTLTRKSFDIHHTCILFSNGVIYPFDECGRI